MLPTVSQLYSYFSERLQALQQINTADWIGLFAKGAAGKVGLPVAMSNEMVLSPKLPTSGNLVDCMRIGRTRIVHHPVEVSSALAPNKWIRGQAVMPVYFAKTHLGLLDCESTQDSFFTSPLVEELEAIAAQIGALWAWDAASEELRVDLDRRMDALKKEHATFDWCGIYRLQGGELHLTSFRGAPTPHPIISPDSGICGAAVKENQTLNIQDVKADSRYLSCDIRTRSELVVPIRDAGGRAIAEIDIDSHTPNAFSSLEVAKIEALAKELSSSLAASLVK
jgi:L-methionine (R)-S-oxide reductase